jgi:hypothetical protein
MHTVLTRKIKTSFRPLQSAITDHVFIRFIVNTIGGIGGYGNPGIGVPNVDDCEGGRWKTRIQYTYWVYISKQYCTDQDIFN